MPMISVLMPVYNAEKYLALAIESILNQTFSDFEFLIFNDGSSDSSKEIIQSFKDPRIKLFDYSTNVGYVGHLNHGIEVATGKYIARMDADDISLPERFEMQVRFLEKNPEIGLCGAWMCEFNGSDTSGKRIIYKYFADHEEICVKLLRHNSFAHPVVMIRRSILIDNGLKYEVDYMPTEDYRLWVTLKKYTRFHNIQKVLLQYRQHTNQISTQKFELRHKNANRIKLGLIEEIFGGLSERETVLYTDIINKTHSDSNSYLSELYSLINKIISTNEEKKVYHPGLLNKEFQNIWKSVSRQCITKNRKVIFFWMKLYPNKNSFKYYAYMFYLLFSSFKLKRPTK
ncbi:MAG: glycosyltransferase [Chitinophagaceae bacterium]|nr:glycosyltransferase [Chitinophagaceae bacterium]